MPDTAKTPKPKKRVSFAIDQDSGNDTPTGTQPTRRREAANNGGGSKLSRAVKDHQSATTGCDAKGMKANTGRPRRATPRLSSMSPTDNSQQEDTISLVDYYNPHIPEAHFRRKEGAAPKREKVTLSRAKPVTRGKRGGLKIIEWLLIILIVVLGFKIVLAGAAVYFKYRALRK